MPCTALSNVIGLSNLVTQPISYKVPYFLFLKSTFNLLWTFPSVSAAWGDFLLCQLTVSHFTGCTLVRDAASALQLAGKERDRRELWDLLLRSQTSGITFFPCSLKISTMISSTFQLLFVAMLQKTGKPVSYLPEWKWHFKKSTSVVNESFVGQPLSPRGSFLWATFRGCLQWGKWQWQKL